MDGVEIDSKIQEYLQKINKGLTFQLTTQNLPRLLSDIALNELEYELESKLLNGKSVQHYIPCHYSSTQIVDIINIYTQILTLTVPQLETEYLEEFSNPHSFGSQQTPNLPFVKSFFHQLDQRVNRTGFVEDFLFKLGLINYCGISVYLYHPTKLSIHFRSPAYTPSRQPDANVVDRLKNLIEKFPEQ